MNVAVVIDDEPDARSLVTRTLEWAGFTVHSARTSAEGVELIRLHSPAVTTLAVNAPCGDAIATVRRIRAFSDTYLLLLTACPSESDTVLGFQSGADSYLTKPLRPLELRARVEAMLRRPRTP